MEYHIVAEAPVGYRCPCSRDRVEEALATLEESDLNEMIESGETIRVSCEFCGTDYAFSPEELLALRQKEK
jgi:molecular chaperone Hsp33